MGVGSQRHAPPAWPLGRPGTHCIGGWVGPRAGLDGYGKSRSPPGLDPRTAQPIGSRYTDCAIPARPINAQSYSYLPPGLKLKENSIFRLRISKVFLIIFGEMNLINIMSYVLFEVRTKLLYELPRPASPFKWLSKSCVFLCTFQRW